MQSRRPTSCHSRGGWYPDDYKSTGDFMFVCPSFSNLMNPNLYFPSFDIFLLCKGTVSQWFRITLVCRLVATFSWFFLKFFLNTTSLLLNKIYSYCLFYRSNTSGVWKNLNCINVKKVWYLVDAGGKNRRPAWGIRGERFRGWKKPVEVSRMICRKHISGYGSLLTLQSFCRYSTFVNWELWWPNFPILVYFKETQTKPEGQVHFFPVIFVRWWNIANPS